MHNLCNGHIFAPTSLYFTPTSGVEGKSRINIYSGGQRRGAGEGGRGEVAALALPQP